MMIMIATRRRCLVRVISLSATLIVCLLSSQESQVAVMRSAFTAKKNFGIAQAYVCMAPVWLNLHDSQRSHTYVCLSCDCLGHCVLARLSCLIPSNKTLWLEVCLAFLYALGMTWWISSMPSVHLVYGFGMTSQRRYAMAYALISMP